MVQWELTSWIQDTGERLQSSLRIQPNVKSFIAKIFGFLWTVGEDKRVKRTSVLDIYMTGWYKRQFYVWRKECRNGMLFFGLKLEWDSFAEDRYLFPLSSRAAVGCQWSVVLFTNGSKPWLGVSQRKQWEIENCIFPLSNLVER